MSGPSKRNPIARAVTRVRPQIIPDKRQKLLAGYEEQRERAEEELRHDNNQQVGGKPGRRNMTTLEEAKREVARHMDEIQAMFMAGAKVTVLVRTPGMPEADFLMTDDDITQAVSALRRRQAAGVSR